MTRLGRQDSRLVFVCFAIVKRREIDYDKMLDLMTIKRTINLVGCRETKNAPCGQSEPNLGLLAINQFWVDMVAKIHKPGSSYLQLQ